MLISIPAMYFGCLTLPYIDQYTVFYSGCFDFYLLWVLCKYQSSTRLLPLHKMCSIDVNAYTSQLFLEFACSTIRCYRCPGRLHWNCLDKVYIVELILTMQQVLFALSNSRAHCKWSNHINKLGERTGAPWRAAFTGNFSGSSFRPTYTFRWSSWMPA